MTAAATGCELCDSAGGEELYRDAQLRVVLAPRVEVSFSGDSYRGSRPAVMKSVMNRAYRDKGQLRRMTRSS